MKQFGSIILFLITTILGFLIPELADLGNSGIFLNLIGFVSGINLLTEFVKDKTGYVSGENWKGFPYLYSFLSALLLGTISYVAQFAGIFAVFTEYWHIVVVSVISMGLANQFYNSDIGYLLIKMITGHQISNNN